MTISGSPPTDGLPDEGRQTEIAAFAAELRGMRERAGSPSLRTIAATAHFSISTLSEATAGKRLPTEAVVRALAAACGEDAEAWASRLRETAIRVETTPPQLPPAVNGTASVTVPPLEGIRPVRQRRLLVRLLVIGSAAIAVFTAGYAIGTASGDHKPAGNVAAAHPANDGDSPVTAGCVPDAHLIDKAPLLRRGVQVGALELEYSAACHAGWARVYLYPAGVHAGLSAPGGPVATVWVEAADGTATAYAAVLDHQQPDYTDVVTPHGGCIKASASLTPADEPAIQAVITCDDPIRTPPTS